jgi:hypothetical protein
MALFSDWPKSLAGTIILFVIIASVTFAIVAVLNGWEKPAVAWILDSSKLVSG